jgi:hypothetical protein
MNRLLTGNSQYYEDVENALSVFHDACSALIFNSGYDANLGVLSCVPQSSLDIILYDEVRNCLSFELQLYVRISFMIIVFLKLSAMSQLYSNGNSM